MGLLTALASTAAAQGEPERRRDTSVTTVGVEYAYTTFLGDADPWHLGSFTWATRRSAGSLIGRANIARRFATNGVQYEVDAYPTLGRGAYAYLNLGYSGSTIFPEWRSGVELFKSLPRAYEASLGFRNLRFPTEQVTLLTGSVGRYTGNYWFSLRPFAREKAGGGLATSGSLTARRYFADADSYVGARIGAGTAPTDALDPSQLAREQSLTFGLQASRTASPRTITLWTFNYERDRNPIRTLTRLEFGFGVRIRY